MININYLFAQIEEELKRAEEKFPKFNSAHEMMKKLRKKQFKLLLWQFVF